MADFAQGSIDMFNCESSIKSDFLRRIRSIIPKQLKQLLVVLDWNIISSLNELLSNNDLSNNRMIWLNEPEKPLAHLDAPEYSEHHDILVIVSPQGCKDLAEVLSKYAAQLHKNTSMYVYHWLKSSLESDKLLQPFDGMPIVAHWTPETLFMPLDTDLVSLEDASIFRDCLLYGRNASVHNYAKSLVDLQKYYGFAARIIAKGSIAKLLATKIKQMYSNVEEIPNGGVNKVLTEMIIFDRTCDVLSPVVDQNSYFGAAIDFVPFERNVFTLGATSKKGESDKPDKFSVRKMTPEIYQTMSNSTVQEALQYTRRRSKLLQEKQASVRNLTIDGLAKFAKTEMESFKQQQLAISQHIQLIDALQSCRMEPTCDDYRRFVVSILRNDRSDGMIHQCVEWIEETFAFYRPETRVVGPRVDSISLAMRLWGLLHLYGLLKAKYLTRLRNAYHDNFGLTRAIQMLSGFERIGLMAGNAPNESSTVDIMSKFVRQFDLYDESTVSYRPLSAKVIDSMLTKPSVGDGPFEHVLRDSPGGNAAIIKLAFPAKPSLKRRTVVVCFIGGILWDEIVAVRKLKQTADNLDIIICCDYILSGEQFIENLIRK